MTTVSLNKAEPTILVSVRVKVCKERTELISRAIASEQTDGGAGQSDGEFSVALTAP